MIPTLSRWNESITWLAQAVAYKSTQPSNVGGDTHGKDTHDEEDIAPDESCHEETLHDEEIHVVHVV